METIKSCPCCGGPGKLKDAQGRQVRQGWVGCPACGLYISWKISPDGAVRKWNRRARADEGIGPYAEEAAGMRKDWWLEVIKDFTRRNGVEIITEDDWKRAGIRILMLRPGDAYCVERLIRFDAADALLPSPLLNDMYRELLKENGGAP